MGERFYRRMFFAGFLWNVVGGIMIILLTSYIFESANITAPSPAYYYSWIALFMTFGIGYYMIYRDMYSNQNIVILGMIGKSAFAAIFLWVMFVSKIDIPGLFIVPVVGDILFVILFGMFLRFAIQRG